MKRILLHSLAILASLFILSCTPNAPDKPEASKTEVSETPAQDSPNTESSANDENTADNPDVAPKTNAQDNTDTPEAQAGADNSDTPEAQAGADNPDNPDAQAVANNTATSDAASERQIPKVYGFNPYDHEYYCEATLKYRDKTRFVTKREICKKIENDAINKLLQKGCKDFCKEISEEDCMTHCQENATFEQSIECWPYYPKLDPRKSKQKQLLELRKCIDIGSWI